MRKVYSFLLAAVATFAAVSCNKEVAPSDNLVEDVVVFTAGFGDETKTTINQEGKSLWEVNDKITLHNGTKGYEFTADMAGRFVPFTYAGKDFAGDKFMAVYPAGEYTADVAAKTVTASVPMYQPSRSNTWSEGASLAVAFTEDDNLYFKNATAMVKFVVYGEKVKSVYFKGNDNEVVSGSVLVTLNSDNTVKSVVGTSEDADAKTAKLWAKTGDWAFEDNTTYYLAVIPQNFKNGFTVQAEVEGVEGLKDVVVYDKAYDLKPNTVLNIGTVHGVEQTWAVAGKFNSWNTSANPMTKEGAYYVLKGVKGLNPVEGSDDFGFKFVVNGTDWKGSVGEVAAGAWEYVWDAGNGSNIYVKDATEEAAYDIYVNPSEGDNGKFVVVSAGTPMPEDGSLTPDVPETPSVEGEASEWGIVGVVNKWGESADIVMYTTSTNGLFVAKNANMPAGGFKIRANGEWKDAANYGLEISGAVQVDHVYDVITSGGSGDMTLVAGTYDIWFDLTNKKVYVMTPGKAISEAVIGKVEAPSNDTWYLVGDFNGWNTKDENYKMTVEDGWYVCKNVTLSANAKVKACNGTWSVNRGGSFAGVDMACSVTHNGDDIVVSTAGTYDIYLNNAADKMYFMTPGQKPAN